MTDELNDVLGLKRPSPLTEIAANHPKTVKRKNGAVVTIGVIFLIVTFVLGMRVGNQIYWACSGANDLALENAAKLEESARNAAIRFSNNNYYEEAKQSLADTTQQATVEGFIAGGLLISGIILLSLSSKHCSECGTKVAIDTVKLCGSCGAQLDRGASI